MGMTLATTLERQVLSALMQNPTAIEYCDSVLIPEDFGDGRHALVYSAILALHAEDAPTDPIALADRLESGGELKRIGGEAWLWELQGDTLTASNAGYYADMLKQVSRRRRLAEVGKTLTAAAEAGEDPDELRAEATRQVEALWQSKETRASIPLAQLIDPAIDAMDEVPRYAPTPWREMNAVIDGWRPGALYIIGARPSVGKSVMGLQAASWLAVQGPVLFASLEMPSRELVERMLSSASGVPLAALTHRRLSEEQKQQVARMSSRVRSIALEIFDGTISDMTELRSLASQLRRRRGLVKGIVVDYLQLIRLKSKRSRWEEVGEITATLKQFAREFDCPVIALAQLNRGSVTEDRPPAISDLRESGSIEQDADVVMLLQRDEEDIPGVTTMNVKVAKNRQGRTGEFGLRFEGALTRLSDL